MKKHIGEIQGIGTQVVMPGSINDKGQEYKIYKDLPIREISEEQLNLIKQKFTKRIFEVQPPNWSIYSKTPLSDKISLNSLIDFSKLKKYKDGEYYGEHPIHGSKNGMNFFANPDKGLWHCFRCDSGGDTLAYLSIKEGICQCSDFSIGGKKLRGDDFKKVIEIGKEKYGLEINDENFEVLDKIKIITDKELSQIHFEEIKWIVKDLIPGVSLVLIAGKTGSMKSILTTYLSFCCCNGLDFLGKFPTENVKILYFDEENPKRITQGRNDLIRRGLGVEPTDQFGYLLHAGLKLVGSRKSQAIQTIINLIKEFNPDLVVLDSLVRFLGPASDENKAGDINEIFTNLRQISIDYKVTFIIIHHMNKATDRKGVDRVRGSTDIVNAVDMALLFDRESPTSPYIEISQEKNRYDAELKPFTVLIESNPVENTLGFSLSDKPQREQNATSKASSEILNWLRDTKKDNENKRFETSDVLKQFQKQFDNKDERNRKIIQSGLKELIGQGKIMREIKGRYKYVEIIFDEDDNKIISEQD